MSKQNLLNLGPGLSVRVSVTNPSRDRGVITAQIAPNDAQVVRANNLYAVARAALPLVFPGSPMPLGFVRAKGTTGGGAWFVGYYGQGVDGGGSGGFRRVFSSRPYGTRPRRVYNLQRGFSVFDPTLRDLEGRPKPRHVPQPLRLIEWSSVVYSDTRPSDYQAYDGTLNANRVTIDGYPFAPESLVFNGAVLTHEKYGGYDRWIRHYSATFDTTRWRDQTLVETVNENDNTRSWRLGDEVLALEDARVVNWPRFS